MARADGELRRQTLPCHTQRTYTNTDTQTHGVGRLIWRAWCQASPPPFGWRKSQHPGEMFLHKCSVIEVTDVFRFGALKDRVKLERGAVARRAEVACVSDRDS